MTNSILEAIATIIIVLVLGTFLMAAILALWDNFKDGQKR